MQHRLLLPALVLPLAACSGDIGAPAPPASYPIAAPPVAVQAAQARTDNIEFPNATGRSRTYTINGKVDLGSLATHPFFSALGTNGRTCASCHQADQGFSITPTSLQALFDRTGGTDPVFRTNDGSTSPLADVSTVDARRVAYRLLLTKGLIRVGLPIPAGAEFELAAVDDPYGFASAAELSLFRRPLPSTNLGADTTVMWDGRETVPGRGLTGDLLDQANGATLGHAQATQGLTAAQRQQIVDFETGLFTTQVFDKVAGDLTKARASASPQFLAQQAFYRGINDVLAGDAKTGAAFDPHVFSLYDAWATKPPKEAAAVVRGQALFNGKRFVIDGVAGLNDLVGGPIMGTCSSCHDSPNFGNHSVPLPIDIGLAAAARRTPDLPLYTLRNLATGAVVQTTDPGRALITGKWNDIGKFKGPILRALAARPPYFHNGSAATLSTVIDMYDGRFAIGFTAAEKADLAAFLATL